MHRWELNKEIFFSTIGAIVLAAMVTGISYAAYTATRSSNAIASISMGTITMSYTEPTNNISITGAMPTSSTAGYQNLSYFEFSVSANAQAIMSIPYEITLTSNNNNTVGIDAKVRVGLKKNGVILYDNGVMVSNLADTELLNRTGAKSLYQTSLYLNGSSSSTDTYKVYLWIDEDAVITPNIVETYTATINVDTNASLVLESSPLSSFSYVLGSNTSTFSGIPLDGDDILLYDYTGSGTNVVVPGTYTIDDVTYNTKVLSLSTYDSNNYATFKGKTAIKKVYFEDGVVIVSYYTRSGSDIVSSSTMYRTFNGCSSLESVNIPTTITSLFQTFDYCSSLVTAPTIPSSVTEMYYTFTSCTSLRNVPVLPSTVASMVGAFYGCTDLVTAPEIPSSVTNMQNTFYGCSGLVTGPSIPSTVTNMVRAFQGCTSLTGNLNIYSSNISNASYIFTSTSEPITITVPSSSTTYTTFNTLTASTGMPSNVTLETR